MYVAGWGTAIQLCGSRGVQGGIMFSFFGGVDGGRHLPSWLCSVLRAATLFVLYSRRQSIQLITTATIPHAHLYYSRPTYDHATCAVLLLQRLLLLLRLQLRDLLLLYGAVWCICTHFFCVFNRWCQMYSVPYAGVQEGPCTLKKAAARYH